MWLCDKTENNKELREYFISQMLAILRYPFFIASRTKNVFLQKLHMNSIYELDESSKFQMRQCVSVLLSVKLAFSVMYFIYADFSRANCGVQQNMSVAL